MDIEFTLGGPAVVALLGTFVISDRPPRRPELFPECVNEVFPAAPARMILAGAAFHPVLFARGRPFVGVLSCDLSVFLRVPVHPLGNITTAAVFFAVSLASGFCDSGALRLTHALKSQAGGFASGPRLDIGLLEQFVDDPTRDIKRPRHLGCRHLRVVVEVVGETGLRDTVFPRDAVVLGFLRQVQLVVGVVDRRRPDAEDVRDLLVVMVPIEADEPALSEAGYCRIPSVFVVF